MMPSLAPPCKVIFKTLDKSSFIIVILQLYLLPPEVLGQIPVPRWRDLVSTRLEEERPPSQGRPEPQGMYLHLSALIKANTHFPNHTLLFIQTLRPDKAAVSEFGSRVRSGMRRECQK